MRIFIATFFATILMFSSVAMATDYAVVNVDRVMATTKAAQDVESQVKKITEKYSKEFSKREQDLKQSQEKLIEENRALAENGSEKQRAEFEKKRKEFEKNHFETQKLFQKRRADLSKAVGVATGKLQKEMFQTVADISEEKGFRIVFDRKSVVIVEESLDITDEVVKAIDGKLTKIELKVAE